MDATDWNLLNDARSGIRGTDQQRIAETVIRWAAVILRKNHDYGGSVWKAPLLAPECTAGTAIRVRMTDKIERLVSLLSSESIEVAESIDDTISDLGAYCLLELARPNRS